MDHYVSSTDNWKLVHMIVEVYDTFMRTSRKGPIGVPHPIGRRESRYKLSMLVPHSCMNKIVPTDFLEGHVIM